MRNERTRIMPKFIINNDYVPVSVYFIENFLKEASGTFLKVYLYSLTLASRGVEADAASVAAELEILESDVLQAFAYWKNKGLIFEENGVIEFCTTPVIAEQPVVQDITDTQDKKRHYDSNELSQSISNNQSLSELVMLAQELLAKPLTQQELETIYWLYDGLGFSNEAILLILDYCISRDKRNMRYIEKVAIAWHEKGIRTAERIMEYIDEEGRKNSGIYMIQKGLGIADRALSNAEEQYIKKWLQTYKMSEDMIMLAYEYCLLNTSKLSMPYMDKIIERWSKQGIYTKDAAEEDNRKHKSASQSFDAYGDNFNHTGLEALTRKRD